MFIRSLIASTVALTAVSQHLLLLPYQMYNQLTGHMEQSKILMLVMDALLVILMAL